MSIQQYSGPIIVGFVGDGVSTTIIVDLSNYIRALSTLPNVASGVFNITNNGAYTITGSSISQNILSVTFSTAPTNGVNFNLNVYLTF
jgi:hypothetical protein